ncbi:MAG: acetylxylan esterase [Bacteroides sp.]|nr:acetylxylan esterase [Bacteroides sp.]
MCTFASKVQKLLSIMKQLSLTLTFWVCLCLGAMAQPSIKKVQLHLVPDHADALYKTGQNVKMKLIALHCGLQLNDVTVSYEVSEDLMPSHLSKTITLKGNEATLNVGTLKHPGYLRVKAWVEHDGRTYTTYSTVGFDTEKLQPTVTMPADFKEFWQKNVEAVRKIELHPTMELIPERCTEKVNVYHISYRNIRGTRMYGMLTMPRAEGKYPAILRLPGAGVGEKTGDITHAAQGAIILELGIHGIPVNLKGSVYEDLAYGVLAGYESQNLHDRDSYFYKRVYLGCVRGIDFLLSLPQCNGRIGTLGGSQGGALSVVTAALDERVNASVVYFPALCDQEGYIHNRAGGWPHAFKNKANCTKEKLETFRYYDTANFARLLRNPVYYAYGYNDLTCAPTTTRSVYNVITAPKQLIIGENIGHWLYPEQIGALWNWIIEELKTQ